MDVDTLSLVAGSVLSLAGSYIPGLNSWLKRQSPDMRRLLMLTSLVVVTAAMYALSCTNQAENIGITITCDTPGLVGLVRALALALIANQGTYAISPRR